MTGPAQPRRVLFVTGTRADFGKLKPLIAKLEDDPDFECIVFVTGMHTLELFGYTVLEVEREGYRNIHVYMNQILNEPMEMVLANTILGLSRFVHENRPDLIVIHGDRVEALAGATVGALRNILVAHIEGGELSGTVDELIRHAVSKLSHLHFVANDEAAARLKQLGERPDSIFVIGSPDIDVMLSNNLPPLETVKAHYEISFQDYAIAALHPVTTEPQSFGRDVDIFVSALLASGRNYVVVYPNNDEGATEILTAYRRLENLDTIRIFPSIQFESFVTLMKNAKFVIGNSSAGIREAPIFGIPTVNVGTRQHRRFSSESIIDCRFDQATIVDAVNKAQAMGKARPNSHFGRGKSAEAFVDILHDGAVWNTFTQKQFVDIA